jgi:hypothetical protein
MYTKKLSTTREYLIAETECNDTDKCSSWKAGKETVEEYPEDDGDENWVSEHDFDSASEVTPCVGEKRWRRWKGSGWGSDDSEIYFDGIPEHIMMELIENRFGDSNLGTFARNQYMNGKI